MSVPVSLFLDTVSTMELRQVGTSGLWVTPIGLGTMTWGRDTDENEAEDELRLFLQAGGNLIDTAGNYGDGEAEPLIGSLLAHHFSRDDVVVCSKAGVAATPDGEPRTSASRYTLLAALDDSLEALQTDHLDIWMVQHYDPLTPVEETLSALEYALATGRTRYVGVSNFPSWALAEYATLLRTHQNAIVAHEVEYSLLNRSIEREGYDAATHCGIGLFAWSPLARGVLTGKYRSHTPPDSRGASSHLRGFVRPYMDESYAGIIEATVAAAEGLDKTPGQVALAWVKDAPGVSAALVGARTASQLSQLLDARDFVLPHQIRKALSDISA